MKAIGDRVKGELVASFLEEEDPEGRPWPENAPSTLVKKRGPAILREKDHLLNALSFETRRDRVIIGPRRGSRSYPYQRIQQQGGVTPTGGIIPPRVYIGATLHHSSIAARTLLDHLRGTL
jgi:hypothetical protein